MVRGNEEAHSRELEALYAVSQLLSATDMQREALREVLRVLEERLGLIRGTVMLLTMGDEELVVEALGETEVSAAQLATTYRKGEGIQGHVLATGQSEIIPIMAREPRFQDRIHRRGKGKDELSFICVPIQLGSEVLGTLSVDVHSSPRVDLAKTEKFLSIVASMIAGDVQKRRVLRLQREALESENQRLKEALICDYHPQHIVGNSKEMRQVYRRIKQVAASETTVLIRGESGTGKELVASALHYSGSRSDGPLIKVNCAALSENLLESELFGHEKGAFTGAFQARKGRIEEAEGGTLFLDEIGEFSPILQVKLLRVLQEREYESVGSNRTRKANVRIIAATHRDLEAAVAEGSFRRDFYYRINVFPIYLPPLRTRKSDILLLANHFTRKYGEALSKPLHRISTPAINMLLAYHWPGNVRELENCMEHAALVCAGDTIQGQDLPPTLQMPEDGIAPTAKGTLKQRVNLLEREVLVESLKRTNGKLIEVAEELGITDRMVRYKIKNLGIDVKAIIRGA
nr:sigma 54-interacting transcriptional regulator [uncultured Holophaga sp.]